VQARQDEPTHWHLARGDESDGITIEKGADLIIKHGDFMVISW